MLAEPVSFLANQDDLTCNLNIFCIGCILYFEENQITIKGINVYRMQKSLMLLSFITAGLCATTTSVYAGGPVPPPPTKNATVPQQQDFCRVVTPRTICRDWPIPTPRRYVGFGAKLNPFYTPTYTYPSERNYEGDNPKYYPFFLPRRWANYKSAPVYYEGDYGYASRSGHYWDQYDEWKLEASQQRQ